VLWKSNTIFHYQFEKWVNYAGSFTRDIFRRTIFQGNSICRNVHLSIYKVSIWFVGFFNLLSVFCKCIKMCDLNDTHSNSKIRNNENNHVTPWCRKSVRFSIALGFSKLGVTFSLLSMIFSLLMFLPLYSVKRPVLIQDDLQNHLNTIFDYALSSLIIVHLDKRLTLESHVAKSIVKASLAFRILY